MNDNIQLAANDDEKADKSLSAKLPLLNDDLYQFVSICAFYEESLRRLAADNELRDKSKFNLGITLTGNWVSEQGDKVLDSLESIEKSAGRSS